VIEALILQYALQYAVDPNVVKAIMTIESGGEGLCMRYEPLLEAHGVGYVQPRDFASALFITVETEKILQHSSLGHMQILGVRARELGFKENLLRLCLPENGIKYGVKNLQTIMVRYGEEAEVISAYNAGSARKTVGGMFRNQGYVDKVYTKLRELRALK
jgi:soluble lytic murein transglycosylase-like protein